MLRSRVILIGAAGAVVLLVAGIVVWQLVWAGPRTVSLAAEGAEMRFPEDAFDVEARPTVSTAAADDEFLSVFGITTGGAAPLVTSVAGPAQPGEPFDVVLDADLTDLPPGTVPAVFTRDADAGLWLPLPTEVDDEGRLVGTAERLAEFAAATLTAVPDDAQGARWLGYQVARDTAPPNCTTDPPPWLLGATVEPEPTAPLAGICAESNNAGDLVLRVAVDRPYPLVLSPPVAPEEVQWDPITDVSRLLGGAAPFVMDETVLAPTGVETVLTWPAGSLPGGSLTISSAATPVSALLDTALTGAELLAGIVVYQDEVIAKSLDCLDGLAQEASTASEITRATAEAAADCLEPLPEAAQQPAADRVFSGVRTGLLLSASGGTAATSVASDREAADVVLTLAEILEPPPDGATVLADALTGMDGVGPSGNLVNVIIDGRYAETSTTQWVGCEGTPAYAEYALDDHERLTGLLGARDYMPPDVVAEVRMLVDGTAVDAYEVGQEAVPLDLELPPGDVLRIEAERIAGECAAAPDAYLVFGSGALS